MTGRRAAAVRSCAALVALVAVSLARDARADPARVALARSADAALDARIAAELSALGFAVESVEGSDAAGDLSVIAHARGAVAAVRVDHDDAIELWVESRHPPDPPIHESVRLDPHRDRNVAAVSALEALRAHLLAVRPAPTAPVIASPAPTVAVAASEPPAPARAAPWLWLHLAIAGEASPGGLRPAADLFGELRVEPRRWIAVSAFGAFSPIAARVDAAEGTATVSHAVAGAVVDLQMQAAVATVSLGAGGAFAFLFVRGQTPAAGYDVRDSSTVTAGPVARACVAVPIVPALRLRAEVAGGATFPRAAISFAGREVASWGRPFGLLTLGLEWGAR